MKQKLDALIGKRNDPLLGIDGQWILQRLEILQDRNVLLAKNLSMFF